MRREGHSAATEHTMHHHQHDARSDDAVIEARRGEDALRKTEDSLRMVIDTIPARWPYMD
jgi:hypothetical protein